jgi:hypothetical protein
MLVVGLVIGALVTGSTTNRASAQFGSTSHIEENHMATGRAADINLVWVLDYGTGFLTCTPLSREGRFLSTAELDLDRELKQAGKRKGKPHFMMVTGRNARNTYEDLVFIAETSSGLLFCIHAIEAPQGVTLRIIDRRSLRTEE